MKKYLSAAVLAIALALPAGAIAGELPAPPFLGPEEAQSLHLTPQQQQQMSQAWSAAHARLQQLHTQGRAQILASLTPQQRSLLAQVVGNLAISPNPDEDAAAQQIQNSLTPQQAQRIIGLHSSLEQQAMGIMQSAHAQVESYLTPDQRQKIQQDMNVHFGMGPHDAMYHHGMGPNVTSATEAGHIVLGLALHASQMQMEYRVRVTNHTQ